VQEEQIMSEFGPEDERLEAIYDRLEELDPNTFEVRAAELLHGLGFSRIMMARKTKDMSGELQACVEICYKAVCI
jgi:ATP-binding cassette subfamily F protein 2